MLIQAGSHLDLRQSQLRFDPQACGVDLKGLVSLRQGFGHCFKQGSSWTDKSTTRH